jgi:thioredoxin 1
MSDKQDVKSACDCGGGCCCGKSGTWIWIVLALAVAGVLLARNARKTDVPTRTPVSNNAPAVVEAAGSNATAPEAASQTNTLPRLVDLGATACIPCKLMAPILEDLKKTYAGKLDVQFIDVWENPEAGKKYEIGVIPTQIFYDASGKELFRHEGFYGKDDILAKWKEFGVELEQ